MFLASETDFIVLYNSVKKILKEMCEQGGRDTDMKSIKQVSWVGQCIFVRNVKRSKEMLKTDL